MLDGNELGQLETACRGVTITTNEYVATDFVTALLETVMDYQNSTTTVERAGHYFETHRWRGIRTMDDHDGRSGGGA